MTVTPEGVTITTSDDVIAAFLAALKTPTATAAGLNVYSPRSWAVPLGNMPILLIQSPVERKESLGPNAPSYDVYSTIKVIGRLTFKALADDAGAALALDALATFQRQIERAVINNFALYLIIEQIVSVDVTNQVKTDGNQPVAELVMDFVCKFYQGPEAFAPTVTSVLDEMMIYSDLLNVFDPSGTYTPPFDYDVTDAPRTVGPDGRPEPAGGILVKLSELPRVTDDGESRVTSHSARDAVTRRTDQ